MWHARVRTEMHVKFERKEATWKTGRKWEDNIKTNLLKKQEIMAWFVFVWFRAGTDGGLL